MRKGFTLIELVMVIVILGILMAFALPRFLDLRTNAQQAAAQGAVAAIRSAVGIYYANSALSGTPTWPTTITAGLFANSAVPTFPTGYGYTYDNGNGTVEVTTP